MEFISENIATIVTALLFVITAFGGVKVAQVRNKLKLSVGEVVQLLTGVVGLLELVSKIGEDNKMTAEETAQLREKGLAVKKELDDLRDIWKKKPEVPDIPE